MKFYNKIGLALFSLLACGFLFTSCEDELDLNVGDDSYLDTVDGSYGYVRSAAGARQGTTIVTKNNVSTAGHVYFELSKTASSSVQVTFKVDQDALDEYNEANGTSYEMYPNVSLQNGTVTIAAGEKKSSTVDINIDPCGNVGVKYAIAVSATTDNGVEVSTNTKSYVYLVEDWGVIPDPGTKGDIKSILYVEVNNESILNAGEYYVNGVPFFDIVSIFAANINLDSEGRPYVYCNDQVTFLLANAEQIIRPLQKKGIKVNLSILGNHDDAGMRSLNEIGQEAFANELKAYLDIYGLDGFDFDDEYSSYAEGNYRGDEAGVVSSSAECTTANYLSLVKLCREKMPEALLGIYWYSSSDYPDGDGVNETIDYAVYGSYGSFREYRGTGLDAAKQAPYAINLSSGASASSTYLNRVISGGYGYMGYYNLCVGVNYLSGFNTITQSYYGADVEFTSNYYNRTDLIANVGFELSYETFLGEWKVTPSNALFYYYDEGGNPMWWDWCDPYSFTVTVEEDVNGESYNVYGWDGFEVTAEMPIAMTYSGYGNAAIKLPQEIGTVDGVTYAVARGTYSSSSRSWNASTGNFSFSAYTDYRTGEIEMYYTQSNNQYGLSWFTKDGNTYTSIKDNTATHNSGTYTFVKR
ncbi:MAG: DUF1735 domain-containing protein [Bacteroidales bacterium]|nr:DUF1735 domain-containing protein [Bacteroidales bacterium]